MSKFQIKHSSCVYSNCVNNVCFVLFIPVDDWRAKWQLDMRYTDATPDDLIRDMADIHPHIRLKAITTCARAAEYMPAPGMGIQLNSEATKMEHVKLLPEKLFIALELCLDDDNLQVMHTCWLIGFTRLYDVYSRCFNA